MLVAFGASARVARSAVNAARAEGIKAGLVRPITLWPFPEKALEATIASAKEYLVVEMNMGQMVEDVRLCIEGRRPVEFYGRMRRGHPHAGGGAGADRAIQGRLNDAQEKEGE